MERMNKWGVRSLMIGLGVVALALAGCGTGSSSGGGSSAGSGSSGKKYVIGVSNTLVGNGFREEMICAAKAEALASGKVSKMIIEDQNGGASQQIAAIRTLISAGANAIVANPDDPSALNPVIAQAKQRGIVFVAADQSVTSPDAYIASNNQKLYAEIGMQWLAKKLHGHGNIVEMRGPQGAPADTARHAGFEAVVKKYPGIHVVKSVYTNWDFPTAAQEMTNILQSGVKVDGVWTSGIDYTVVDAFKTAGKPIVPIVGADNNGFMHQMLTEPAVMKDGAMVNNPAIIGGVATNIALEALEGKHPPKVTMLHPSLWDASNVSTWKKNYQPDLPPTYGVTMSIPGQTHFTPQQLKSCKGP
ncbi:MAG: substrate-binding domain-containing protein [Solirubrobacteraceae bacterium]